MKIEVKKDGKIFYRTDDTTCIPSDDRLKSIVKAGYKVYENGKIWKPKKTKKERTDNG